MELHVLAQSTAAEQKQVLDDLLTRGVAGVSVSAIDPTNETDILNKVASQAVLFTTDSDAASSKRVLYIGTDNVAAGVQAGQLINKALPKGGKIMLFVGTMGARERPRARRGHQEDHRPAGRDPGHPRGRGRLRQGEAQRRGHADQVPEHRRAGGPVVVQHAADRRGGAGGGKQGQVQVIGFDEDPVTLRGVADGIVIGTVVQQPYEFGYQSMKLLAKVIEGDKSVIPANHLDIIPTKVIDKDNVADFQKMVKMMLGK